MADQAAQKKQSGGTWKFIVGLVIVGLLIVGLSAAALGGNLGQSAGPNPRGAEIPQVADPTNKSVEQFQDALQGYIKPNTAITERQASLTALSAQIAQWQVTIHAKDSGVPAATQTALDQAFGEATTAISGLQAKAANPGTGTAADVAQVNALELSLKNAATKITQLMQDSHALDGNRATRIVSLAQATIAQNNGGDKVNGKYVIPYVYGGYTVAGGMDCSGFISYLLQQVGLLPVGTRTSTETLPNQTDIVTVLIDNSSESKTISASDLQAAGMQPGDIIVSNNGSGHMVMYLGGSYDDPKSVAESTDGELAGKSGPEYDSVTERLGHGHVTYLLRPNYGS